MKPICAAKTMYANSVNYSYVILIHKCDDKLIIVTYDDSGEYFDKPVKFTLNVSP